MHLEELMGDDRSMVSESFTLNSIKELLGMYLHAFQESQTSVLSLLNARQSFPKRLVACIKACSVFLTDNSHDMALLTPFCKVCISLSSISGNALKISYTVLLLQVVAKITCFLDEKQISKMLLSIAPMNRPAFCTNNILVTNISRSAPLFLQLLRLVLASATLILLTESHKTDGRMANYLRILDFMATNGPAFALVAAEDSEAHTHLGRQEALRIARSIIPSSILHILIHRTRSMQTASKEPVISSELNRFVIGIRQYMLQLYSLSKDIKDTSANTSSSASSAISEQDYSADSDANEIIDTSHLNFYDILGSLAPDEVGFLASYSEIGLHSLNKALVLFITNYMCKESTSAIAKLSQTDPLPHVSSNKNSTALATHLVERLFSRSLTSYFPVSDLLSRLATVYFSCINQTIMQRILHIFHAVQESGPVGKQYISDVLYPQLFQHRISLVALHRRQSIYLLKQIFPVSEDMELMKLDLEFLVDSLIDNISMVREAAVICSVSIMSRYYDCLPFAKRSKLFQQLCESTFDSVPAVRSLAINGIVEMYKVPSLRTAISVFVYSNGLKLSLLLLPSSESRVRKIDKSVQNTYIKLICSVVHSSIDTKVSNGEESRTTMSEYRALTTSMRLFYSTIYAQILEGDTTILKDLFPRGIQTLLNEQKDGERGEDKDQSEDSKSLWSFLVNIVTTMGCASGSLITTVVEYFRADTSVLKLLEARLLGYVAILRIILLLSIYVYGLVKNSIDSIDEIVQYILYDRGLTTISNDREQQQSCTEFCLPLETLLDIIPRLFDLVLETQHEILQKKVRRMEQQDRGVLVNEIMMEIKSACSNEFIRLLQLLSSEGMKQETSIFAITLSKSFKPILAYLVDDQIIRTCDNDLAITIDFSVLLGSLKYYFLPSTIDQWLNMYCHLSCFSFIDRASLAQLFTTLPDTMEMNTATDKRLSSLSDATKYKKMILRYYNPELVGVSRGNYSIQEILLDILRVVGSVYSWKTGVNKDGTNSLCIDTAVKTCDKAIRTVISAIYTEWYMQEDSHTPANDRVDVETTTLNAVLLSINYLLKVLCSTSDTGDLWLILAKTGLDSIIIALLLESQAAYSSFVALFMIQLHRYSMSKGRGSDSMMSVAMCINNEGAIGRIFTTDQLEGGTRAVVLLLLRACITSIFEQTKKSRLDKRVSIMTIILERICDKNHVTDINVRARSDFLRFTASFMKFIE